MYRPSAKLLQPDLFTSANSLFSGKSLKIHQDHKTWHNVFRTQVTMQIDESLFQALYSDGQGSPNASIRVMIAMMILKESQGISDQQIFEHCRFNMLMRSAIGLINADTPIPTESTYYLFRKKVGEYAKQSGNNLFEKVFLDITKKQSLEFEVSGKQIRMDSKLLESNIAWLSRYELVHETFNLFYQEVKECGKFDRIIKKKLDEILKENANKVVYDNSSTEIKSKMQELGELIWNILPLFEGSKERYYSILKKVFEEQFKVDDSNVKMRKNKEISAKSIQSPHDIDCHYRDKNGNKVKGYSINLTESCNDEGLNLIGNINVKEASSSDVIFFQEGVEKAEEVFLDRVEDIHTDGAYHSPENQNFCTENKKNLYLNAIQGSKGRYELILSKNRELIVLDTLKEELLEVTKIEGKNKEEKWRIKTAKGYRYFSKKEIGTSQLRSKMKQIPKEVLQKRNNVEASLFQLCYHYPNAKSRYRGLIKHEMWANMRGLWVNFVRILKWIEQIGKRSIFLKKSLLKSLVDKLKLSFEVCLKKTMEKNLSWLGNLKHLAF